MNDKPFVGINVGKGNIDLTHYKNIVMMRPIVIYFKEDGDKEHNPSLAILMNRPDPMGGMCAVGEISLKMWNDGLGDIGYKIVPV